MPQIINQNGTVVDLISHGPIEGLVRGAGSIILDGTPINTANVIGSSGSASTETVQFKAKINSSSGTTSTFIVPLLSVSHILEKECNIDGTLKDPLLRYLWVDKAGQTFSNYTQVGQIMNGGTGLYGDTDHDLELPFAIGPIDGLQAFGSEKDKSNLKYTFKTTNSEKI